MSCPYELGEIEVKRVMRESGKLNVFAIESMPSTVTSRSSPRMLIAWSNSFNEMLIVFLMID